MTNIAKYIFNSRQPLRVRLVPVSPALEHQVEEKIGTCVVTLMNFDGDRIFAGSEDVRRDEMVPEEFLEVAADDTRGMGIER